MSTRRSFVAVLTGLSLAPVALNRALAQEEDKLDGRIQMIDKEKSTIWLRVSNATRYVVYDSNTKFTYRNKPGALENLKDNDRVICLGKFDEDGKLKATRVDARGN